MDLLASFLLILDGFSKIKRRKKCFRFDTGYPHDGRANKNSYPHDRRADKDSYPSDGRADKDSYPHDRHNQYIMLSLYLWLSFSIDRLAYIYLIDHTLF